MHTLAAGTDVRLASAGQLHARFREVLVVPRGSPWVEAVAVVDKKHAANIEGTKDPLASTCSWLLLSAVR